MASTLTERCRRAVVAEAIRQEQMAQALEKKGAPLMASRVRRIELEPLVDLALRLSTRQAREAALVEVAS